MIGSPAICDPIRIGTKKVDNGWKEVMSRVQGAHKTTKIDSKFL